jgi:hypothetical protein
MKLIAHESRHHEPRELTGAEILEVAGAAGEAALECDLTPTLAPSMFLVPRDPQPRGGGYPIYIPPQRPPNGHPGAHVPAPPPPGRPPAGRGGRH